MKAATPLDTARLELMLADLRLLGIKTIWPRLAEQSDREGWPAARFLAALAEHEMLAEGTPQGAVISPLLSNIYLDPLDHLMEQLGDAMVRYADDFVVLCRSPQHAAGRRTG